MSVDRHEELEAAIRRVHDEAERTRQLLEKNRVSTPSDHAQASSDRLFNRVMALAAVIIVIGIVGLWIRVGDHELNAVTNTRVPGRSCTTDVVQPAMDVRFLGIPLNPDSDQVSPDDPNDCPSGSVYVKRQGAKRGACYLALDPMNPETRPPRCPADSREGIDPRDGKPKCFVVLRKAKGFPVAEPPQ